MDPFCDKKVTYFLGPWGLWALLSYADLTKHPSGPTPFPTNAPREKHIPVLVRTRAYPCTEQSRAEFSSAKFSCSETVISSSDFERTIDGLLSSAKLSLA